jgi:uncharacterized membrane protein YdjX (TVP38/TMEM64 family)
MDHSTGESKPAKPSLARHLPLAIILIVAVVGFVTLRDYLTFDTLRDNREALLAYRDANITLMALAFIAIYFVIVAFSLPGAAVASVTGGFLFGLVPAVPFFVANLLPALVGVRFFNFAFTTVLGIIPGAIVFTWIGVGLGEVFDRGDSPDLSLLWEPQIIGPILGLSALAALPMILKAVRGKKEI